MSKKNSQLQYINQSCELFWKKRALSRLSNNRASNVFSKPELLIYLFRILLKNPLYSPLAGFFIIAGFAAILEPADALLP